MINKKSITIQPLKMRWTAPPVDQPWTNNSFSTFTRLLRSDAYHIDDPGIDMTGDIYFISSFDIANIRKETELVKKLKDLGKKVVVSFSQDLRFLIGNCLDYESNYYTEVCKNADVILQGISDNIRVYGRYQDKAISFGVPMERLKFHSLPYERRTIDIFASNNLGEENWGITTEFLYMLKETLPNKHITYSTQLPVERISAELRPIIEFVPAGLLRHLPNSKMYVNLELRPRPGRSLLESWYHRTPFVSCESAYHSNLFPDFTFKNYDLVGIVDLCKKMLDTDYDTIINKAENIAEYDYFDNFYPRLMEKLYG